MPEFTILVVCLGNICRSPLAAAVLRMRLSELTGDADLGVRVTSAGVLAMAGHPMDPLAAAQLRRLGGDPDGFIATQLTADLVAGADLVLTATRGLRTRVLEEHPRAIKRTFTLLELAAVVGPDVAGRPRPDQARPDQSRPVGLPGLVAWATTVRAAVARDELDVPDPIGQGEEVHRRIADLLDGASTTVARSVVAAALSDVASG